MATHVPPPASTSLPERYPERTDGFHIRAAAFQPVRGPYARAVIRERLGLDPKGKRALVVGCGRGLLARELARLGFAVVGVDPLPSVIQLAQEASVREGVRVQYEVGDPPLLRYNDGEFDIAYYTDTLEIMDDLDRVVAEAARVLRPRGIFLYDTVNRTRLSRLVYLGAMQSWRWTRYMPPGRYTWERLRPPAELAATMTRHGLHNEDVTGFLPANPLRLLWAILRARRGNIDDWELARLAGMHIAPAGKHAYLGFGIKQP
jgi:2-polyprenyl-6-hydroxyphenyl methylase / 3-demethylubiquinone-9 3-methyltransferase